MAEQQQDQQQEQATANPALEEKQKRAQQNRTQVTASVADVNTLTPEPGEDVGESQVQEVIDAETEAGFRGLKVDPTPNSAYAASNSAAQNDEPTPETDQDLRREARNTRKLDGPEPF
jgi:hypothetical protein